ncbi:MAG: ribosomal protein S18-alanine N-acetyltransferase [Pseudomonadota bacterium]|mgnify:CR=1 FL=1
MKIEFQDIRSADAEALASLNTASFPTAWGERWSAGDVKSALSMGGVRARAAKADGSAKSDPLIGFVLARQVMDEAEILLIGVDTQFRRQGIGQKLLEDFFKDAKSRRIRRVFLEVRECNEAARALYRKLGFITVGQRPGYYRNKAGKTAPALTLERRI